MTAQSTAQARRDDIAPSGVEVFQGWEYSNGDLDLDRDGWYYWQCAAGCMPDSDAMGPFGTFEDAVRDAQEEELELEAQTETETPQSGFWSWSWS